MLDELIDLIKSTFDKVKSEYEKEKASYQKEINELKKSLELSESGRQNAENMLAKIKSEVTVEIQKAYKSGYNAAIGNLNPAGGQTITENDDVRLVFKPKD